MWYQPVEVDLFKLVLLDWLGLFELHHLAGTYPAEVEPEYYVGVNV